VKLKSLLVLTLASACSTAPSGSPDTGVVIPHATPGICKPDQGGTGNNLNVGAYCSPGGSQCGQYTEAPLCSIDLDPEGDNFCIRLGCKKHSDCGNEGCCTGRATVSIKACVPKGCLTEGDLSKECPPIPGIDDAGVSDAGSSTTADAGRAD
jgi:hypothetical protein